MTLPRKVHLGASARFSWCGLFRGEQHHPNLVLTYEPKEVTCRTCIKIMEKDAIFSKEKKDA